jgi:GTPase Era involved in 16S rRNA processing
VLTLQQKGKMMSQVQMTYNPYFLESSIVIDNETINDGEIFNLIDQKRLDLWIEQIIPVLAKRLNENSFTILFKGIPQDFEDIKKEAELFNRESQGNVSVEAMPGMEHNTPASKLMALQGLAEEVNDAPIEGLADTKSISILKKALETLEFQIFVIATMSSGKSTLINAILGRDILPEANKATTAKKTYLTSDANAEYFYGQAFKAGKKPLLPEPVRVDREKVNAWNQDGTVTEIRISGPIPMNVCGGKRGKTDEGELTLVLVDTPGTNSYETGHEMITLDATKNETPPLILFIIDCTHDLTHDTNKLWEEIATQMKDGGKRMRDRFLFVANKIDAIDPEKEGNYGLTLDHLADYLKGKGITNPRILPVCSRLAKLLRCSRAGDKLTKHEESELSRLKEIFIDDESHLLQYITPTAANSRVTVSSMVEKNIRQRIASSKERNTDERFVLYSGIPILEEVISEYIHKYGLTEIINNTKEKFNEKLQLDNVAVEIFKEIEKQKGRLSEIHKESEEIRKRLETGKDAEIFRKCLEEISFKKTQVFEKTLQDTRKKYYEDADKILRAIPQKIIFMEDAKGYIDILKNNGITACGKLRDNFQGILQSTIIDQAEIIREKYISYYNGIFETKPEMEDCWGNIKKKIEDQLNITLPNLIRGEEYYAATIRAEVGEKEISDSIWYKPWTWFSSHYATIYCDKPAINMHKVSQDVQSRLSSHFETAQTLLEEHIDNRIKYIAQRLMDEMKSFDAKLTELSKELSSATKNKESLKETILHKTEQATWLKQFTNRLNTCLNLQ